MHLFTAYHSTAGAREAGHSARQAQASASHAQREVQSIKMDVEKLLMITEALWTILQEQHGLTDDELIGRIERIDLRDGKLDGQVAKQGAQSCPKCNRALIGKRPMCLYCGTPISRDPFDR